MIEKNLNKLSLTKWWTVIGIIALLVPCLLIFKSFFGSSSLSLGDAPYFSQESISWSLGEPSAWTGRGNALGSVNQFLFISPLMLLISLIQQFTHANHWILIRFIFYFPSLLLGFSGAFFFAFSRRESRVAAFITSFLFLLNTYYLLLVDGGQVGIVLAYGLFPWALVFILKYIERNHSVTNLIFAVLSSFIITIADPRVALIVFLTASLLSIKNIKRLAFVFFWWVGLSLYWLYPLLTLNLSAAQTASQLKLTSFLNGLFLYSPHWYENIYGKITYPTLLFIPLVILFIVGASKSKNGNRIIFILTLLFIFLVKGETNPLGELYATLLKLPFGIAFRDSSKFFIPLTLFYGIIVGRGVEYLTSKFKFKFILPLCYLLLLLPLFPALVGNMNFVLSGKESNERVEAVNNVISKSNNLDRTAWIPERDPRAIDSTTHGAVDGKFLSTLRPLASINVGDGDLFNFFNDAQTSWWLPILGVKNIVLSGNPRVKELSDTDSKDWNRLNTLLPTLPYIHRISSTLPIYSLNDPLPKIYGLKQLFVVVGGDDIYGYLKEKSPDFSPKNNGFLFTDDGRWDPAVLSDYSTKSAVIIRNNSSDLDFAMSTLKKYFLSVFEANTNDWAKYSASQYLTYKYELLIRKFIFNDFDFNKGISFSTKGGEAIVYKINIAKSGDYAVSIRALSKDHAGIKISLDGITQEDFSFPDDRLRWSTKKYNLNAGDHELKIISSGELQIVNLVAITPFDDYHKALSNASIWTSDFKTYNRNEVPVSLFDKNWEEIPFSTGGTSRYNIEPNSSTKWVVLSDSFSPMWRLSKDRLYYNSMPLYSATNIIYRRPEWSTMTLEFSGQEKVRWGIYYSVIVAITFMIYVLLSVHKK